MLLHKMNLDGELEDEALAPVLMSQAHLLELFTKKRLAIT